MLMPTNPFVWDEEVYRSHIESVATILGEYLGGKHILKRSSGTFRGEPIWKIIFPPEARRGSLGTRDLQWAIDEFIRHEPLPELI